ncbi:sigma-70 family RNA polymerase sigma factor [Pseudomaricurvus alkylphenolicus]|jgi:RNA polymerase sigma-70 factor (ECF subfamily)|uniref:sigma-70 family RNA polymerase sigma factor n=1 Tax=Pseudomaricurvus alkylphenolicus TaxID=1306991 RepID=UPI00141FD2CD|nr:sigma-70 family RNA polymerase sigma factor [Pseudomaricurvus alkylphenolicus]NIB43892.1 sigma-70 family RNA polymerase sigma factor [Pseudomaricurvus alkylphenolicus]
MQQAMTAKRTQLKKFQALQSMFQDHNSSLLRFLTRRLSDPHEAEDIAQDAYHNLLRMDAPEELENARAYLFQTAANLAQNRMRKQRRQDHYQHSVVAEADEDSGLDTASAEKTAAAQLELEKVMAAVELLPEKCRRVFTMSRAEHKSYPQISEELGISVSTVEKHLIKALDHLRKQLSGAP